MFRVPATLNRMKCASNVLLRQGSRFARPMSTSAFRPIEAKNVEHNVEELFNAESGTRPDSQKRRGRAPNCINRIELLGGVADFPVERSGRSVNNYLSFNMFTNVEYRKSNGSFDENVELHNVLIFGKQVDYVRRNVEKGCRVFVIGRLHYVNGPLLAGQVSRSASIVADLVQVIAKAAPREERNIRGGDQDAN